MRSSWATWPRIDFSVMLSLISLAMTHASLDQPGRPGHARPMTVVIYILVNLGAELRVFGPATDLPTPLVLSLSAMAWSGAYVLFAFVYDRFLLPPGLDEE